MNSFKSAAREVLTKAEKPLHYREITEQAIQNNLLESNGKTPWATMNAQLSVDIRNEDSEFYRAEPGFYGLKRIAVSKVDPVKLKIKIPKVTVKASKGTINSNLNSKQKGDIGEARIAELITLCGNEGLSCYKPISDDEGIDIIAKRRGKLEVAYIQVKTSYGYKERGFVATVKRKIFLINQECCWYLHILICLKETCSIKFFAYLHPIFYD